MRDSAAIPHVRREFLKLKDKIRTVYVGILEPNTFIDNNQGIKRMEDAGRNVVILNDPQLHRWSPRLLWQAMKISCMNN